MSDLPSERQYLEGLIQMLTGLVKKLSTTRPCGPKDGPIAKNFSDLAHDTDEGPYYTFNKAWERVFQCLDSDHLIVRGKYGLELVLAYIVHFSNVPGIEALQLVAQRVDKLVALLEL